MNIIARRLFPFASWIPSAARDRAGLRQDLMAGATSATIMLPQALVFAQLAGLPPQYGLYASIFPVIIAALFGSSRHMLSGPNTAMSILTGVALAPWAAQQSPEYLTYCAILAIMVGIIQIAFGILRLGRVLDFVPRIAMDGVSVAVGLTIILTQVCYVLGLTPIEVYSGWLNAWTGLLSWHDAKPDGILLFALTLLAGLVCKARWMPTIVRKTHLALALAFGSLALVVLQAMIGSANVYVIGHAPIMLFPLHFPALDGQSLAVARALIPDAIVLALLGLLQSAVISRTASDLSGQPVDTNEDVRAQGLANLAAGILSGYPTSGSFNRSRAHQEAGAMTPLAAVASAVLIAIFAYAAPGLIARIPYPAMSGVLVLVAWRLVNIDRIIGTFRKGLRQGASLTLIAASGVFVGLAFAVWLGVAIAVVEYLARAATPNVKMERRRNKHKVELQSPVFFGSVHAIAGKLRTLGEECGFRGQIELHVKDPKAIDHDGLSMLQEEARRWHAAGGRAIIVGVEKESA